MFAGLGPTDFSACPYHDGNWPLIADLARAAVERAGARPAPQPDEDGTSDEHDTRLMNAVDEVIEEARQQDQSLTPEDIDWPHSLFQDPMLRCQIRCGTFRPPGGDLRS